MPIFDMLVVGAGGGPDETNLSAYLFKPFDALWEDGIVALDAGSGQGALTSILSQNPRLLDPTESNGEPCRTYSASDIYSYVRGYLITHAHLDHINSLVLSAGSLPGPRKKIHATRETLKDLETVFSDRIWPNLASWDKDDEVSKLLYTLLPTDNSYWTVHDNVTARAMPLNHGKNQLGIYESVAFFIRHEVSRKEFLFFGDLEPDSLNPGNRRTIDVWQAAAQKIPEYLSSIFIECSWPSGRLNEYLYGHLTPEHLVDELAVLAAEVVKYKAEQINGSKRARKKQRVNAEVPTVPDSEQPRGALKGLRVFITHCKANGSAQSTSDLIAGQVRKLVEEKGLGAEILVAQQGMRIQI